MTAARDESVFGCGSPNYLRSELTVDGAVRVDGTLSVRLTNVFQHAVVVGCFQRPNIALQWETFSFRYKLFLHKYNICVEESVN
jgi:hypothetical protein